MTSRHIERRTGSSYGQRIVGQREEARRFLIVCEGQKTEPNYFIQFRAPRVVVQVDGAGDNTKRLVERAEALAAQDDYDEVWIVMDRDSFPAEHFNAALEMAKARRFFVAYSNEAFELWYLLHFDFLQSGLPRAEYQARLTVRLGEKYEKNSRAMYDKLRSRMPTAIRNAEKLLAKYDPQHPERDNPSTTVHVLVARLAAHSRP